MPTSTSPRLEHVDRSYYPHRKHTPQISISDDSHHVTEAIGGMYGSDDEDYHVRRNSRPLSFIPSPSESFDVATSSYFDTKRASPPRTPLSNTLSNDRVLPSPLEDSSKLLVRQESLGSENSPTSPPPQLSRKSSSTETAVQQFPLNDIDYESSPAAVAQELSNLQAIRRMSMNVDTADPDLPSFSSGLSLPPTPPSHDDDEDDASRLFWVPARLHPELAPKEFKTFVEDRVDRIRQRSGSGDSLSPTLERSGSDGLRRKKSMLSRQIDTSKGYKDGADRLERKRSEGKPRHEHATVENLSELENLVNDPSNVIRNISLDTTRRSLDSGVEVPVEQDMPILPPLGSALKRSTRTTYRRGSLRKGERVPFSKRALGRQNDTDTDESPGPSPIATRTEDTFSPLARVQTEPTPAPAESSDAAPQPQRAQRPGMGASMSSENLVDHARNASRFDEEQPATPEKSRPQQFHSRIATNGRTTAPIPGVPQIIETPPQTDRATANSFTVPERKSSHTPPPAPMRSSSPSGRGTSSSRGSPSRSPLLSQRASQGPSPTLDDISSHPSPLPGSGGTRTDALTMVPTFEDKKVEKRDGIRKTSWNWLMGGEEKEREKEKEKERQREREREEQKERESSKKIKSASSRLAKGSDKTRLDVLQSSIDGNANPRGRESLVLDRESIKLDEERKKESSRRSGDGSAGKKEKDSGLLSAIFGGKKSKASDESTQKKRLSNSRTLSPEPPPRVLKPDVDYNWTRFSILEERAIYRMAHIKLANPKRALHSQVLLSNFMYSYLAKVQMMHPQMQIPASQKSAQSRNQNSARKEEKQAEEYNQYQRWQEQQAQLQAQADTTSGADRNAETGSLGNISTGERHAAQNMHSGYQNHQQQPQQQRQQQPQRSSDNKGTASGHDYLGYATHEQPFEQKSLWDDTEGEKEDDLW